jgi:hypothetical protein
MIKKRPLELFFKPMPGGFKDDILRVEPDILPRGSLMITHCEIDGKAYTDFNSDDLTVKLPKSEHRLTVKVTVAPK